MYKRGVSDVVTIILIIGLTLLAIGIVWAVIATFLSNTTDQISEGLTTVDLRISKGIGDIQVIGGSALSMQLLRDSSEAKLVKVRFLLTSKSGAQTAQDLPADTLLPSMSQRFEVPLVGVSGALDSVAVQPIILVSGDTEKVLPETDSYVFEEDIIYTATCTPECSSQYACGTFADNGENFVCGYFDDDVCLDKSTTSACFQFPGFEGASCLNRMCTKPSTSDGPCSGAPSCIPGTRTCSNSTNIRECYLDSNSCTQYRNISCGLGVTCSVGQCSVPTTCTNECSAGATQTICTDSYYKRENLFETWCKGDGRSDRNTQNPGCYAQQNNIQRIDAYERGFFQPNDNESIPSTADEFVYIGSYRFEHFEDINGVVTPWKRVDYFDAICNGGGNTDPLNESNPGCYAKKYGKSFSYVELGYFQESDFPGNIGPDRAHYLDTVIGIGSKRFMYFQGGKAPNGNVLNPEGWRVDSLFTALCDGDSRANSIKNVQNPGCYALVNGFSEFDAYENYYLRNTDNTSSPFYNDEYVVIRNESFIYERNGKDAQGNLIFSNWARVVLTFSQFCLSDSSPVRNETNPYCYMQTYAQNQFDVFEAGFFDSGDVIAQPLSYQDGKWIVGSYSFTAYNPSKTFSESLTRSCETSNSCSQWGQYTLTQCSNGCAANGQCNSKVPK